MGGGVTKQSGGGFVSVKLWVVECERATRSKAGCCGKWEENA